MRKPSWKVLMMMRKTFGRMTGTSSPINLTVCARSKEADNDRSNLPFDSIGKSGSLKRVLDMCSVYSLAMGVRLESEQHDLQRQCERSFHGDDRYVPHLQLTCRDSSIYLVHLSHCVACASIVFATVLLKRTPETVTLCKELFQKPTRHCPQYIQPLSLATLIVDSLDILRSLSSTSAAIVRFTRGVCSNTSMAL